MQRPAPRRKKPAVKKTLPTWALVWIALTLVVLVIFMASKSTIDKVLETTGFAQAVQGDPAPLEVVQNDTIEIKSPQTTDAQALTDVATDELIKDIEPEPLTKSPPPVAPSATEKPLDKPVVNQATKPFKTYFVTVNGDGQIDLSPVTQQIVTASSPLTAVMKSLLEGPNPSDLSRGYLSLIPTGTRLLSIRVEDSTAFLSFSEDFQFNTLGMEGYSAQLKQIVYTATEFSTVKQVQILIEGKVREFLGSESIPIGSPLTRSSFNR